MSLSPRWIFLKWQPCHFPGMACCYKLIQLFRVTCFIAGKYNTALSWHITDYIETRQIQYQNRLYIMSSNMMHQKS